MVRRGSHVVYCAQPRCDIGVCMGACILPRGSLGCCRAFFFILSERGRDRGLERGRKVVFSVRVRE